jgi:hypothetical protein
LMASGDDPRRAIICKETSPAPAGFCVMMNRACWRSRGPSKPPSQATSSWWPVPSQRDAFFFAGGRGGPAEAVARLARCRFRGSPVPILGEGFSVTAPTLSDAGDLERSNFICNHQPIARLGVGTAGLLPYPTPRVAGPLMTRKLSPAPPAGLFLCALCPAAGLLVRLRGVVRNLTEAYPGRPHSFPLHRMPRPDSARPAGALFRAAT